MTLDGPLRIPSWLFCLILSSVPIGTAWLGYTNQNGFLSLPRFGEVFRGRAMAPVKEYAPPAKPNDVGYDGQFYAQIALDPTLRDPALREACDNLSYRAKRIALPGLAYALGGGHPWAVLQIYATLNVLFWFLLLIVLLGEFGIGTWNRRLLIIGILWNAGCLISIGRALTDLPALCLGVLAVCLHVQPRQPSFRSKLSNRSLWWLSSVTGSLSVLTKETALLSLFGFCDVSNRQRWRESLLTVAIVLIPAGLWMFYVREQVGTDITGLSNFSFPFFGFIHKLLSVWREAIHDFPRLPLLEMIAPWSIVAQCVFMIREASWRSKWWRFGIGFVLLAIVIGPWVWATQSAYSRSLLPLAVSFNVLLSQASLNRSTHTRWWLLGNIGLMDRAAIGLLMLVAAEFVWRRFCGSKTPRLDLSIQSE